MTLGELHDDASEAPSGESADGELRAQRDLAERNGELAELRAARIELLERSLAKAQAAASPVPEGQARVIELEQELARVTVRLARIQSSLPMRVWARLRGLPPMSSIAKRRTREYWRELESARRR